VSVSIIVVFSTSCYISMTALKLKVFLLLLMQMSNAYLSIFCYPVASTTAVLWPFVRDYPDEPVPEETFTHSHLFWSSIIFYLLPLSTTIHGLFPVKFTCLVYLLVWHPPLHTPYISSPNHCLLFATHAHTSATCSTVVPRLSRLMLFCLNSYLELVLFEAQ